MFLQNTPKDWAHQDHLHAFAQNSKPISLNVSPHELVFHIRPLTFDLNFNRNKNNTCISQYCSQIPENSHYDKPDPGPSQWFLAVGTAMLKNK